MKNYIAALCLVTALLGGAKIVNAQGVILLATRLPAIADSTDPTPQDPYAGKNRATDIFTGQDANRNLYNAQFVALAGAVVADDTGIYKTLYQPPGRATNKAANVLTNLGDVTYVAPALGLLYAVGGKSNQTLAWHAGLAAAKAGLVGIVLKAAVGRHRPIGSDGGGQADRFSPGTTVSESSSFPSGHTLVAFSVASVWAHERPHQAIAAYGLATLVGLSRVALGRHWPSDVLLGAALGISQGREVNNGDTGLFNIRF